MGTYIEGFFTNGFTSIFGDPLILAIVVLAFFGGFVLLQNTRMDGKIVVLAPASILVALIIPWWMTVVLLVIGFIAWRSILKFTQG